ncbi:hypothetical protein WICPIJ_002239 [Wickerhamomyces pijperi]|uniref:Uncharacterized protein n=1 Tax=Wickerhamomyces pijperi TaxID=599730 RepID=A0A9P8QBT3_WICPI|nr:hypothetical protein WICPIJ_002239 [Wickerhamomyces pijperi]
MDPCLEWLDLKKDSDLCGEWDLALEKPVVSSISVSVLFNCEVPWSLMASSKKSADERSCSAPWPEIEFLALAKYLEAALSLSAELIDKALASLSSSLEKVKSSLIGMSVAVAVPVKLNTG